MIMSKEEIAELFEQFLNETGQWYNFKEFIESQGYNLEELGFKDED